VSSIPSSPVIPVFSFTESEITGLAFSSKQVDWQHPDKPSGAHRCTGIGSTKSLATTDYAGIGLGRVSPYRAILSTTEKATCTMTFDTPADLNIQALVFDILGTVVDEGAARSALTLDAVQQARHPDSTAKTLYALWSRVLREAEDAVAAGSAQWKPVEELSQAAFTQAAASLRVTLSDQIRQSLRTLEDRVLPWPEAAVAMQDLRRTYLVAGLTNGSLATMARMSARGGLAWHTLLSTEAVRTFKPDPSTYEYAIDRLALDPGRTLFVAAHPWDLRAAAAHGFRTAFVYRPDATAPTADDSFDLCVEDLAELSQQLA
jgi:2-haloacid dehalogenase